MKPNEFLYFVCHRNLWHTLHFLFQVNYILSKTNKPRFVIEILVMLILLKGWSRTKNFYLYDPYYCILCLLLLFQLSLHLFQLTYFLTLMPPKLPTTNQEIHLSFYFEFYCFTCSVNQYTQILQWFYISNNIIHIFIRSD